MSTFHCTTFDASLIGQDFVMHSRYFLWDIGDVVCLGSVFRDLSCDSLHVMPRLYVPDVITPAALLKVDAICSVSSPERAVPLDYFLSSGSLISRRDD